jgi:hypothetical protein
MRRRPALALLLAACFVLPGPVSSADASQSAASQFTPLLPTLARARIPVYLPAVLPPLPDHLLRAARLAKHNSHYAVFLSRHPDFSYASLVFWMTGDRGAAARAGVRVSLGDGVTGYVFKYRGGEGLTISWSKGGDVYMIGGLRNQSQLAQAARSVVRVH